MKNVLFLYYFCLIIACNYKKTKVAKNQTPISNNAISKPEVNEPKHLNFAYYTKIDTSLSLETNILNGYVFNFYIAGNHFELKHDTALNITNLSKLINNKWQLQTTLKIYYDFEFTIDDNNDGFKDITTFSHNNWSYVNYYLPKQKTFSKQYKLPGDANVAIDQVNGLYANYRTPYSACNNFESQLIDYSKDEPKILYYLTGETNCKPNSISIIKLYKYNSRKEIYEFIKSYPPWNVKELDFEAFWKSNYKKLLNKK